MIISYKWLLDYLPEPLPVNELCTILTAIGLEVEAAEPVETIRGSLAGLVIGEVLTCERHPNADKLSLTTVTLDGINAVQIVCGAPNVAAGQKVVVAPVGVTVYPTSGEPFVINKAKIRGLASEGMICAEDEIGLGSSHSGIMILPADARIGILAKEYFKIPDADYSIHIGLTPNRSDANSHIGVARDVCAYLSHHTGRKHHVMQPTPVLPNSLPDATVKVHIDAVKACKRYSGISITGIKVGASPSWLQQRLSALGVRSINNVVDITNYVLHEYGQPLHAFDQNKISNQEIIVRFADEGAVFTGLDGKERKLQALDLMICDSAGMLAMGGVFGGDYSGITDATTTVFIESAYFDPLYVRRTSMYHGLRTDAATHFEKGVDINNVIPALIRAATLTMEICGGVISSDIIDCYPVELQPQTVSVSFGFINKLTGKKYEPDAVKNLLQSLGFEMSYETTENIELIVPTNKADVKEPADIVEEILRIDGLDNVQPTGRLSFGFTQGLSGDHKEKERIAQLLCGMGMQEIVTNSITNSKYYAGNEHLVHMINNLSSELDVMRAAMLEGGLEVICYNCNRKNNDLKLFEFGNVYAHRNGKYIQETHLALWQTGSIAPAHWQQKPNESSIYYMKGTIDNLLKYIGINDATVSFTAGIEADEIVWKSRNKTICKVVKVTADKLKMFDIKQDVYYADVFWDVLMSIRASVKVTYNEVPKFPAVQRDIAMILDDNITYKMVADATEQLNMAALQSYGLFDIFESEKLGKGKKSYALNYIFQVQDRTLTDAEIEQMVKQLMDAYKNKLNAQIKA